VYYKKWLSGTAIFSKKKPLNVIYELIDSNKKNIDEYLYI